jgi:hypothetical protein
MTPERRSKIRIDALKSLLRAVQKVCKSRDAYATGVLHGKLDTLLVHETITYVEWSAIQDELAAYGLSSRTERGPDASE